MKSIEEYRNEYKENKQKYFNSDLPITSKRIYNDKVNLIIYIVSNLKKFDREKTIEFLEK